MFNVRFCTSFSRERSEDVVVNQGAVADNPSSTRDPAVHLVRCSTYFTLPYCINSMKGSVLVHFLLFVSLSSKGNGFHFARVVSPIRPTSTAPTRRRRRIATRTTTTTRIPMVFDAPLTEVTEQMSTQTDLVDRILDESLRTSSRRPIMIQFDPSRRAMWRHWKGTIIAQTWRSSVRHGLWAMAVYLLFRKYPVVKDAFAGFAAVWGQLLGVTTFTLTFFVNQSYGIWGRILFSCRDLQGRLNDFLLMAVGFAQRTDETTVRTTGIMAVRRRNASEFTGTSRKFLLIQARYVRLFTILLYASLTKSHRPLLTPLGLRRMVARGLMSENERLLLKQAAVPANSRHNVVLMWMFRTLVQASKTPTLQAGAGFEQLCIQRIQEIRGLANGMESVLKGRMPFAYAHIVQVVRKYRQLVIQ